MSCVTTTHPHGLGGPHVLRAVAILACLIPATVAGATDAIELASVHAAVGDLQTGKVHYAKRDDITVPIASITKLMTAMVVLDARPSLDEWVSIVDRKDTYGKNSFSRLRPGSQATREQLLRLALMSSENLASYVLAHHYEGGVDGFIDAMNAKAAALGMTRTQFDDPSGLSPKNLSTASDLLTMIRAAYGYETIRRYSTTSRYTASLRQPRYNLSYVNTNPLTASRGWDVAVSKTGYLNEAGRCLVMITEIDGSPVAMVFLNSFGKHTPLGDAGRVRRWLQTGRSGSVAKAARDYEKRVGATYEASL